MQDLRQQLRQILGPPGRVALVGMGNPERSDDGAGVRLVWGVASQLGRERPLLEAADRTKPDVLDCIDAGRQPERFSAQLVASGYARVVFADAVVCGAPPGTVVLIDSKEIGSRYVQFSTHRLSLGLLVKYIEQVGKARVWLLGVESESVRPGTGLSTAVEESIGLLERLITESWEVAKC